MEITVLSREIIGIDIFSDRKLSDLEYADVPLLLREHPSKLQVCLSRASDSVFGIRSALSRCQILMQNWISSKPNPVLPGEQLDGWAG